MSSTTSSNWDIQPPLDPTSVGKSGVISLNTWAHEYGVIPSLVPFGYRSYDPVEFVVILRKLIEDAQATKATFASREIFDEAGIQREISACYLEDLIRLAGSWMYDDGTHFETGVSERTITRWINPEYVHVTGLEPSITKPRYRIEELRRAASLGISSQADIGPRFGIGRKGVESVCNRHDIPWGTWRDWGKARIARTVRTIVIWTDWTIKEVAAAINVPKRTLEYWMYTRHASDFEVPADPSYETWFAPHSGRRGDRS